MIKTDVTKSLILKKLYFKDSLILGTFLLDLTFKLQGQPLGSHSEGFLLYCSNPQQRASPGSHEHLHGLR